MIGTEPLKWELNKTLCSRLLILCILQRISSLVFVEFDYYYSFNVLFDIIYYNLIRAIKLIIDVKVSDFSEEWKLSIEELSAGGFFRDILLVIPFSSHH